jgi:hypothetical protein
MMGKGGVGKSTIAVLLAQFLRKESVELRCADLDPTNASFHAFKAIGAEHINIADDEFNIDPVGFDILMEKILTEESDWVIDTGAATFLPFMNYIVQNEIFQFLEQHGRKVIIHTPLVGGPAMEETIRGLKALLQLSTSPIVVWENEFFGPVAMNGKRFVQTGSYEQFKDRIVGIVRLKKGDPKQEEKDMLVMNSRRLTWDEATQDSGFLLMQRQRLSVKRREIDQEIEKLAM